MADVEALGGVFDRARELFFVFGGVLDFAFLRLTISSLVEENGA